MLVSEIEAGTKVSIEAYSEDKNVELQSTIIELADEIYSFCQKLAKAMGYKHFVAMEGIFQDGCLVNFDNFTLNYNFNAIIRSELYTWRKVVIKYIPIKGQYIHVIFSNLDVQKNNRRKAFRLWLGCDATCSYDEYKGVKNVMLKDISITGIGLIVETDTKMELGSVVKVQFIDKVEATGGLKESSTQYTVHGVVVNMIEMDNGKVLIGCQFPTYYPSIGQLIAIKQRQRAKVGGVQVDQDAELSTSLDIRNKRM